ncbi:MAG: peptidase, partial [Pseudomonadota bacterium]
MSRRRIASCLALLGALWLPLSVTHAAARIAVINFDGPDEGFNDPTPVTPVGGNPATTLGQARLNAVQYAANQVGLLLNTPFTILVRANFNALGGNSTAAVLAQATPQFFFREFSGAPRPGTWYASALADLLSGIELNPGNPDIGIQFNKDIDGGVVLGTSVWYYGLDRNVPTNP